MSDEKAEIVRHLSASVPFTSATEAELASLAASASLRRFRQGAHLFLEGERPPAAWVLCSGRVRILSFGSASRTFQIERFGPRQVFGICCRVGGGVDRYVCTAVAESAATAVRIPDAAFHAVYDRSHAVARATCGLCVGRLRGLRRQLDLGRRTVRQRVARTLLGLRETGGDRITATRHALAAWVGAAPETVFRALAELRERGAVKTGRGTVSILDAAKLARAADDEPGA